MNKSQPTISENPEPSDPKTAASPSPEDVLNSLHTILTSAVFSGAARQQRLLRHLVERRLDGRSTELKEYTLGVEVFDRGEDFDPRLDPIVRVEASRLRSRLQKYYDDPGASDRIRITLPRGAYVPAFEDVQSQPPAIEPEPATHLSAPALEPPPPPVFPAAQAVPVLPAHAAPPHIASSTWVRWVALGAVALTVLAGAAILWRTLDQAANTPPPDFVNFRRITSDQEPCTSPTFSPDGHFLVYARKRDGKWSLYQRDLNGLGVTELTPDFTADNYQPAWSPDARTIAFRSERDGGGIFLLDVKTRKTARLTDNGYNPAWSPDSKKIVYSTGTFTDPAESSAYGASSLRIITLATHQIKELGAPGAVFDAVQPAWSPDGRRIAFWGTDRDGDRDIWTISAGGSSGSAGQPVRVTHDTWTDWSPTWAPDGRYLYFSSDRGGAMNLWRVRINQRTGKLLGRPEAVTTPSPYSGWTTFASDGKQFAYVHRLASSQLYRAPFDPEKGVHLDQKVELTGGERSVREPEMSPDGKWIVLREQDPQEDLALIHPDGTDLHRITNDPFSDRTPHWSPDGREIVFMSNRTGRFELWSIHPDGTGLKQLTHGGALPYVWTPDGDLVGYPASGKPVILQAGGHSDPTRYDVPSAFRPIAWSPNGQSVVGRMRSNAFSRSSLFIFTPYTADYWEIAPSASYPAAVWLTDGYHLLFSREEGIYLADLHTHEVRQMTPTSRGEMHSRFALSRDDRNFFFVVSDDQEDIWVGSE